MHELLKKAKEEIEKLNKIISTYKDSDKSINHDVLYKWIQYKNILNMYLVCRSFQRGSLHYENDLAHAVKPAHPYAWKDLGTGSSLSSLKPIIYHDDNNAYIVPRSYILDDECQDAAKTLSDLLFSHTIFECRGGVQIVYYLTLLDLLKSVFGLEEGSRHFNQIFGSKSATETFQKLNRLRLGVMSDYPTPYWYDYSILYSFCTHKEVTLEDLQSEADSHIGARFWVGGIKKYTKKHPTGSSQGENVIFLGLNNQKEPLFFCIPHVGEAFFITYNELLKRLHSHYNNYPEIINSANKNLVLTRAEKSDLIGLHYGRVNFSPASIASLIDIIRSNNYHVFENFIQNHCKKFHEEYILKNGYVIKNGKYLNNILFFQDKAAKYSQDDSDLTYQTTVIKKKLKGQQEKSCKDDIDVRESRTSELAP
ncbi:Uncharacterised protein [Legionella beliardensis]|uniref:Uncharacterized protein n=1 Tax=Legionella beliardensis TaxID=91822 RepID=A0A378HZX6_9GAMM|nr:hypothetical protein [Legionella beliardensis]STX27945.1 Uncharacterised protein [Legionella beliardensis]